MSASIQEIVNKLENRSPLPPLVPDEKWDDGLSKQIMDLPDSSIAENEHASKAARSGLLLWNDDLNGSHDISQGLSDETGSYWHGIMHRREGDFSNAKYWFTKAGDKHPVYYELYDLAWKIWPEIRTWGEWKPDRFIDEVERTHAVREESSEKAEALRKIQALEFRLLLAHSLKL